MVNVLVTGGLGVIGTPLVRELKKRGHEVWVCDQMHSDKSNYSRCDVRHFHQVQRMFEEHNFDYVYHLAAEFGRWNGEDYYETLWASNVIGTKNIIRMQEKLGFRLIYFSSSEVYGDYDGIMREEVMDQVAIKQLNDYAMTKWVGEMQVINSAEMKDTESVRLRLFNTYGPGEYYSPYRSVICMFIYRALHNLPYTVYLNHHRTSSYIDDTVRTLAKIVENFIPGEVYNIAGTQYHDIKYLSELILDAVGIDDSTVNYKEAEAFTTKDKQVDTSKAGRDLSHKLQIPLEEGIPLTVEWYRKIYNK